MVENDLNDIVKTQVEYHENNQDYLSEYYYCIGDTLQLEGKYSHEEIEDILQSKLRYETDYSYCANDDDICVFPVGEIEISIKVDISESRYNELNLEYPSKWDNGSITFYICQGMNVRITKW